MTTRISVISAPLSFADLVRRYLEFRGYDVNHVMNITDVEDKIIRRVREQNTTLTEYTAQYEDAFFADLKVLNCTEAHHIPKATDHIPEMIDLIAKLMERGIAYQASRSIDLFFHRKLSGLRLPIRPAGETQFRGDAPGRTR